jgi:hypothetical protein
MTGSDAGHLAQDRENTERPVVGAKFLMEHATILHDLTLCYTMTS